MTMFETKEEKVSKFKVDWEELSPKNILIYGESKVGKTYAAISLVKTEMEKDEDVKMYVINTDMGFAEPAKQHGMAKFKDRIEYYYVTKIQDAINIIEELKKKTTPKDYVIFDLVNWIWDESQQEFIDQLAQGDSINFISTAMKDPKKFGMFTGMQWQSIKKVDSLVTNFLTRNLVCNVIGITGVKSTEMEDTMSKSTQGIYSKVGKPTGRKDLAHEFATILRISRNGNTYKRTCIITGARKANINDFVPIDYDTPEDLWTKIHEKGVI